MTGNIARILDIDAFAAEIIFSYFIIICAIILLYLFLLKLFDNDLISVIGTALFVTVSSIPVLKYTNFAAILITPLLMITIYHFLEKKDWKRAVMLGVVYGILSLTHSVAFVGASLLLTIVFIYYEIIKDRHQLASDLRSRKIVPILKKIYPYAIVLVIGIGFALLWWFKPIFIYHGQASLHYMEWNNQDFSTFSQQMSFLWLVIKSIFFNFATVIDALRSILTIIAIGLMFVVKDDKKETGYIKFIGIASIIIALHYFVTQNLFHISYSPGHMIALFIYFAQTLFIALGIYYIYHLLHTKVKNKKISSIFLICILLAIVVAQMIQYTVIPKDQWVKASKTDLPASFKDLSAYLVAHSSVDDNILTTKETGFAINSLTGRKLVASRRAHNDVFVNMDEREMAAAIILYGNDTSVKKDLLIKYNVTYVYWDYYWIQSEYYFNDKGQVTGWFDPLIMFDSKEYEQKLKDNGVQYFLQNTWVDPALKGDAFKKFDLIFISPMNYNSYDHPWDPNLDPYLTEVWNYTQSGQKIAALYKVVNI